MTRNPLADDDRTVEGMSGDDLIAVLEDAGLSPYQADAYVTILELGAASATDIADASSVPDPRIYDVLRDLEEKEYIETYDQGSLHARAHDPSDVLADLEERAERFEAAAAEIEDRWEQPEIEETKVSIVKRFETVIDRASDIIENAQTQVQVCVDPEQYALLRDSLVSAMENGANVRLSLSNHGDAEALPDADRLRGSCTEARSRNLPSPFVVLVDRTWTCFAPHDLSTNEYGVIVDDRTLTYVFHWYFLTCLWEVHDVVYTTRADTPSTEYVDLRQFVRDIEPLVEAGDLVTATVEGYETETGRMTEITGTVVDRAFTGVVTDEDEQPPLSQLAGQVYVVIDTGDGEYTVGGWGAMLEDVEAVRITVENVE